MSDHPLQLLIIDDSPEDRTIFRRYLTRNSDIPYQISEAKNAEEGLQLCKVLMPDCVLMDYTLPDMDGMMLLQQLQASSQEQEMAIIFLTGSGDEQVAVTAMKRGAQDYLVKGKITPETLRRAVSAAIEKATLTQQIKQQQRMLAHQHKIFSMLAENAPDVIARIDKNLRYIYINPAIQEITGLAATDFFGKTNHELPLPQDYIHIWEEALREVFATGQAKTIEYPFQTSQGLRYFQTHFVPEIDQHNELVSALAMTRDVSEHKQEIQKKDNFISLVTHELRTPLTALQGNVQLAMRRLQSIPQIEEHEARHQKNQEAYRHLQRALQLIGVESRLINDLLDVSRIQADKLSLNPARANLNAILQAVVEDQRRAVPQRTIELHLAEEALPVQVDQDRIEQVINNYLTNAIRYSTDTSTIHAGVTREAKQARVWVTDHGSGLTAEAKEHVWERFYQGTHSARSSGGLGLGLYICKTLISLHGGSLGVESEPGKGSTFWFLLPLLLEEADHPG